VLEKVFKSDDISDILYDKGVDKQHLVTAMAEYEIYEQLGIEEPENEEN
jgi:hypothetical protein